MKLDKIKSIFKNKEERKRIAKNNKINKKILILITIFLFILIIIQSSNFIFTIITSPRTYFLNIDISFKSRAYVKKIIEENTKNLDSRQVIFNFNDKVENKIIKRYDLNKILKTDGEDVILNSIFNNGFNNYELNLRLFAKNLFSAKKYNLNYYINKDFINKVKEEIGVNEVFTENAKIVADKNNSRFVIKKESAGFIYDFKKMEKDLSSIINKKSDKKEENIYIDKIVNYPKIKENDLEAVLVSANSLLQNIPIKIYYRDIIYKAEKKELLNWVDYEYTVQNNIFEEANIKIKKDLVVEYLKILENENNKEPKSGELVFDEKNINKVKKFTPIQKGFFINMEDSYNKLQDTILNERNEVFLTIDEKIPENVNADIISYGFIDEIAVGSSNFAGSSASRIINIKIGSASVNGTIVKPNEEFSMLKTLGDVGAKNGYVQELVIKGNSTTKEYGGGLCQVGTTMFRTALNGGFPITERRNHSYRVSYYEPAGTDATIYSPSPDFRFFNNTKNNILITTEMSGTILKYRIWGTKDGRKVSVGTPIITNIVLAPGTKWIETLDLKPGEKKCIETSHNGADAEFAYKVEYEDGSKIDVVFKSRYRPWQAVCLIGVEKLSGYGY